MRIKLIVLLGGVQLTSWMSWGLADRPFGFLVFSELGPSACSKVAARCGRELLRDSLSMAYGRKFVASRYE